MDGAEKDIGWEDLGSQGQQGLSHGAGAVAGQLGSGEGLPGELTDTVTSAMVSHFAREFTQGSLALWPQLMQMARQYFNVTHSYVLRKGLWLLAPMNTKKKSEDGEIGGEKDWGMRVVKGLEVDIEVPDAYIPTMGFVTYVLLYCLIQGLEERFNPDILSATLTFAMVVLVLETTAVKAALFVVGAAEAPVADVAALMGYQYFHLSLQMGAGLLVGGGWKPQSFLYKLFTLGLFSSCGVATWQILRRLPRLQPARIQDCGHDMHKLLIKVLPVAQVLICWLLLPSWSKRPASGMTEAVTTTTMLVASALNGSDAGVAGVASHKVEG